MKTKNDIGAKQSENAYSTYGSGAEAKLRLTEIHSSHSSQSRKIPMAEGRMRNQESNKFSSSLEANISFPDKRGGTKITTNSSPKPSKSSSKNVMAKNPFEDDSSYDDDKNPFAKDAELENEKSKEYDNNLNPFE